MTLDVVLGLLNHLTQTGLEKCELYRRGTVRSNKIVGAIHCQERLDESGSADRIFQVRSWAASLRAGKRLRQNLLRPTTELVTCTVYYLRCKAFLLETDHRNLIWIEKSDFPIVVRLRVFILSLVMLLRRVAGFKNTFADWLSCIHTYFSTKLISFWRGAAMSVD